MQEAHLTMEQAAEFDSDVSKLFALELCGLIYREYHSSKTAYIVQTRLLLQALGTVPPESSRASHIARTLRSMRAAKKSSRKSRGSAASIQRWSEESIRSGQSFSSRGRQSFSS